MLRELVPSYCRRRICSPGYREQLEIAARQFDRLCDKQIAHITADDVNTYAAELLQSALSRNTAKKRLSYVRLLLDHAADCGGCERLNGHVARIRGENQPVRAFTPADVRRLLEACENLRGKLRNGIIRSDWWRAYILTAWDTGLRRGDLLRLKYAEIAELFAVRQQKSNRVKLCRTRDVTRRALQRVRGQHTGDLALPWPNARRQWFAFFKKLCQRAGVVGTAKFVRRGGATQVWASEGPEAAAHYLGHADLTGALALRHYVDRTQLREAAPMPPEID